MCLGATGIAGGEGSGASPKGRPAGPSARTFGDSPHKTPEKQGYRGICPQKFYHRGTELLSVSESSSTFAYLVVSGRLAPAQQRKRKYKEVRYGQQELQETHGCRPCMHGPLRNDPRRATRRKRQPPAAETSRPPECREACASRRAADCAPQRPQARAPCATQGASASYACRPPPGSAATTAAAASHASSSAAADSRGASRGNRPWRPSRRACRRAHRRGALSRAA